jgi:Cu/Ag efflux protein CusF
MKLSQAITFLGLLACLISSARAQTQASSQPAIKAAKAATQSIALAGADVVKVYRKEKRVLLRHGPIPSLGMSAMTMEFALSNAKMINSLKPGDKIKFRADQIDGDYVVTFIEFAK